MKSIHSSDWFQLMTILITLKGFMNTQERIQIAVSPSLDAFFWAPQVTGGTAEGSCKCAEKWQVNPTVGWNKVTHVMT